jgi:signal peptidase II
MPSASRRHLFWSVALTVVALDQITKAVAVARLSAGVVPIFGDWLLFRLVYNKGAAFGIYLGPYSRWIFLGLALVALVVLGSMVRHTQPSHWFRLTALGLVCGGAVGNLIDRIRSADGVVDFIDVYIGPLHWPTFNVADMGVTCGAIALAAVLWREGHAAEEEHGARERTNPAEA